MTDLSRWSKFTETFQLAVESSREHQFSGGLSGLELEFNLLDRGFKPVSEVGFGPGRRSFAEHVLARFVPEWARSRFQLEVFNWMAEAATKPYYDSRGTALEGRVLEGILLNALSGAGLAFSEKFFALHGNLLFPSDPSEESVPEGWGLAKRKYLAHCVALFGGRLATAGIHTNHSYPEALLSWDFFHLPRHQREGRSLEEFRNDAVIRATRLLRPFCPLFIAVSASTPLAFEPLNGGHAVVLTERDSNRLLTFPNPAELDVPSLYASHRDYLAISYDLVRKGVRFGANNWTPVRARSDVEPVNRNLSATTEQLSRLYQRGLYRAGEHGTLESAEKALIIENLCARVDLPMSRVEVRTDEGGDTLELSRAKLLFKELIMLRIYAEAGFGVDYTYDADDVARARRNEESAARRGLEAEIDHPFSGAKLIAREYLSETLADLKPLAEALGHAEGLLPLDEMARGGANPAGEARLWFSAHLKGAEKAPSGRPVVPRQLLTEWVEKRQALIRDDCRTAYKSHHHMGDEGSKLAELLHEMEAEAARDASLPIRLQAAEPAVTATAGPVAEVLALSQALCRIPSVTNCARERIDEVWRCARFICGQLRSYGAAVRLFEGGPYPAVLAGFPGGVEPTVTLAGHFDVVEPDPNDAQFEPLVEGDYLWARGAADMKTVVATDLVWMRRAIAAGVPYPPVNLLLVGNEENGEALPFGTQHALEQLRQESGWAPALMLVGERTGEKGDELFGDICTSNRGVARLRIVARGERAHTGLGGVTEDLAARLIRARAELEALLPKRLTLSSPDGWATGLRFPFLNCGETGVYNLTPAEAVLGVEIRPIPEDSGEAILSLFKRFCAERDLLLAADTLEGGIACPAGNPYLGKLLSSAGRVQGRAPKVARKLAGTSARFAPSGNGVVWGQSGVGPHSRHERHFIPSIEPYLAVLDEFARSLLAAKPR